MENAGTVFSNAMPLTDYKHSWDVLGAMKRIPRRANDRDLLRLFSKA